MDPTSEPNKGGDNAKRAGAQSSDVGVNGGSLGGESLPEQSLTQESLRASDRNELQKLVERALGSIGPLNALIDQARALCEDPDESLCSFRDTISSVLAHSIGQRCCSEPMRSSAQLEKLLTISEHVIDAIDLNPNPVRPVAINELLSACVTLASKLDEHRNNLENLHASISGATMSRNAFVEKWKNLYVMCIYQVNCGLEMPGFEPSQAFREECKALLSHQLSWQKNGLGPIQSESAAIAEVWSHILSFAETLGDSSFHAELLSIAEDLLERGLKTEADIENLRASSPHDGSDNRIAEALRLADALDECERRALGALLHCQFGCASEGVWKRILETKPYRSSAARTALIGLSHLDANEAAPYLVKMLELMASPRCPENVRARLIKSIESFLEEPAAPQVFLSLFDQDEPIHLQQSLVFSVISLLSERLERHHQFADDAKRALSKCGTDQLKRENVLDMYEEKGVIWEPRVLAVLDYLVTT